jgi:prepilin-type processing-associated H-X9-DG protein
VLIIFALAAMVLVGFVAMAVDAGFLMSERRQAQSAADAGALAAATDVLRNKSLAVVQNAGKAYAAENADVPQANVTINWPPASGEYAGNMKYVEAIVTKEVDKFFVGALYDGDWEVTARAVAGVEPYPRPYALLALNAPGLYINGTTTVYVEGGSAMSNSNISSSGGSNIFFADGSIDAAGTISGNSNWSAAEGINPGLSPILDPLLGTPVPPKGTTITSAMLTAAGFTVSGPKWTCAGTCTLPAGYYHHSNINPTTIESGGTVNLAPGTHFFDGNITLSNSSTTSWIRGTNVLLYFTGNSAFTPKNGNVQLTAPSSSPYSGGIDGMLLWIANCSTFVSSGNGVFSVEGVIYAPCSHVELHGTPGGVGVQVIVGDLVIQGTSEFRILYREYVKMDKPKVWLTE